MPAPDAYVVIGNPVAHSRSPMIHAAFARETGQSLTYERLFAPLDGFVATVAAFRDRGGLGANVTAPFKLEAFALAREHTRRAELAGAVNTLAWRGEHWLGDNTDGAGLVNDLTLHLGVSLAGARLLIVGAGGAARGLLGPLLAAKPAGVWILNRTVDKARALARRFCTLGPVQAIESASSGAGRFDVVINATSAGHSDTNNGSWPEAAVFAPAAVAYDLSYGPAATPFLDWARAQGASRVADGLGMLVEQAAESFELWRGVRPHTSAIIAQMRAGAAG